MVEPTSTNLSHAKQKAREIRGLSSCVDLIGGGEGNRTPVQKHRHMAFSERSQ